MEDLAEEECGTALLRPADEAAGRAVLEACAAALEATRGVELQHLVGVVVGVRARVERGGGLGLRCGTMESIEASTCPSRPR